MSFLWLLSRCFWLRRRASAKRTTQRVYVHCTYPHLSHRFVAFSEEPRRRDFHAAPERRQCRYLQELSSKETSLRKEVPQTAQLSKGPSSSLLSLPPLVVSRTRPVPVTHTPPCTTDYPRDRTGTSRVYIPTYSSSQKSSPFLGNACG